MKRFKNLFSKIAFAAMFMLFGSLAFGQTGDVPEPKVDTNMVNSAEDLVEKVDDLETVLTEFIKQFPQDGIKDAADAEKGQSWIYVLFTIILPGLIRKMGKSKNWAVRSLAFLDKIKSNGVLSIVVTVLVVGLGFTLFKNPDDSLTLNEVINTFGWASGLYILINFFTRNRAKTPKAVEETAAA